MSETPSARETLAEMGLMKNGAPDMLELGYAFGAGMVVADGRIDPDELYFTAALASELFPGFDSEVFEQRCRDNPAPPTVGQLAPLLAEALAEPQRQVIFDFMFSVCQTDGEIAPEELALLRTTARDLRLPFGS
ncbi:MAG: TerB family tellurite resistance protein [Pseudomonadales bacterium]|nr:TerB family tellurite resistance protein [Pseudomonadales bacterium]